MILRLKLFFARRIVRSVLALWGDLLSVREALNDAFIDLSCALAAGDDSKICFYTMVVEECRRWMSRQSPTRGG